MAVKIANGEFGGKTFNVADSVVDMARKMQRYVFPPKMDFITYNGYTPRVPNIDPFVMYIFEFEHKLSKYELSNIWQNVMPDISVKTQKKSASISHKLLLGEMMKDLPTNIRWMVFKVKQKGEKNYFTKTADTKDDVRFKFNFEVGSEGAEKESIPDYSFNWPYDYFSLVELAKVDAAVRFDPLLPDNPETLDQVPAPAAESDFSLE